MNQEHSADSDAAVAAELRAYAEYIEREGCGTVDQDGTVWANVPVAGPRSIFALAALRRSVP